MTRIIGPPLLEFSLFSEMRNIYLFAKGCQRKKCPWPEEISSSLLDKKYGKITAK